MCVFLEKHRPQAIKKITKSHILENNGSSTPSKHGHTQLRPGGLRSKKEIHTYEFVETVEKGGSGAVEKTCVT